MGASIPEQSVPTRMAESELRYAPHATDETKLGKEVSLGDSGAGSSEMRRGQSEGESGLTLAGCPAGPTATQHWLCPSVVSAVSLLGLLSSLVRP